MVAILILGLMLICAVVPFILVARLMRAGHSGAALTILSVAGGAGAVFFYATGRPFGIDPILAMTIVLLGCVPAILGSLAGITLGWLLRKRDDRLTK